MSLRGARSDAGARRCQRDRPARLDKGGKHVSLTGGVPGRRIPTQTGTTLVAGESGRQSETRPPDAACTWRGNSSESSMARA
jgi:hypothetical protein